VSQAHCNHYLQLPKTYGHLTARLGKFPTGFGNMKFITENFLLCNKTARRLYYEYADGLPIIDYHCHLPPRDIALDRRFNNLFEIWLEGDHYKWRAMRSNGEPEKYCTGAAEPYEKFMAWARTVPHTLRNPLYHWTHLELQRYFGINKLLNEQTAPEIWKKANTLLAKPDFSVRGILKRFKVEVVCTTDDPADDLTWHEQIAAKPFGCRVLPTFRPDKAMAVHQPSVFKSWLEKLGQVVNIDIRSLNDLETALRKRHDFFHSLGGRLSDHGLERCYDDFCTEREAKAIFLKAISGRAIGPDEQARFAAYMMLFFGRLDAEKGWTKQLHIGAMRNNNTRCFKALGPDTGFDSIGDWPQASALARFLDRLDQEDALPRIILYNLNPAENYVFGTMLGNFQDGKIPGKIQLGSGWWFLDQKEGIEWQLNTLSNLGLLSRFVGMLTDSRSFMSFPRHEYFRRVLCNLIGRDVENGELPRDERLLKNLVQNICYYNARNYFGFYN